MGDKGKDENSTKLADRMRRIAHIPFFAGYCILYAAWGRIAQSLPGETGQLWTRWYDEGGELAIKSQGKIPDQSSTSLNKEGVFKN